MLTVSEPVAVHWKFICSQNQVDPNQDLRPVPLGCQAAGSYRYPRPCIRSFWSIAAGPATTPKANGYDGCCKIPQPRTPVLPDSAVPRTWQIPRREPGKAGCHSRGQMRHAGVRKLCDTDKPHNHSELRFSQLQKGFTILSSKSRCDA